MKTTKNLSLIRWLNITDVLKIDINGPLKGLSIDRNLTNFGQEYSVEFDLMVDKRLNKERSRCYEIVTFELHDIYPGAWYCFHRTVGMAFECSFGQLFFNDRDRDMNYAVENVYPIDEIKKMYHVQIKQFRQIHLNNKLRRFIKLGDQVLVDSEIDEVKHSNNVKLEIRDLPEIHIHIYNMKIHQF